MTGTPKVTSSAREPLETAPQRLGRLGVLLRCLAIFALILLTAILLCTYKFRIIDHDAVMILADSLHRKCFCVRLLACILTTER